MNVDFTTAIKLFFANYANFRGRSTRAEYWFVQLFLFIVSMVMAFLIAVLPFLSFVNTIWTLAIIVPTWAITVRRFHDSGKSGKLWVALFVASIVFAVIAIIPVVSSFTQLMSNPQDTRVASLLISKMSNPAVIIGLIGSVAAGIVSLIITLLPSGPDNKYGLNPYGSFGE